MAFSVKMAETSFTFLHWGNVVSKTSPSLLTLKEGSPHTPSPSLLMREGM